MEPAWTWPPWALLASQSLPRAWPGWLCSSWNSFGVFSQHSTCRGCCPEEGIRLRPHTISDRRKLLPQGHRFCAVSCFSVLCFHLYNSICKITPSVSSTASSPHSASALSGAYLRTQVKGTVFAKGNKFPDTLFNVSTV